MSHPQQIDRYLVERELGRGAFGTVYRARHAVTGRAVALRVLLAHAAATTEMVERFFREARAAASTMSPHIVDVLDASVAPDGAPFLALELLEGDDLEAHLARQGRLRVADALRIAREIASGLDAAHRRGVVHRDLKPANVFLARRADAAPAAKILDFGMSKLAEPSSVRTGTGTVMGTPLYMAPEQLAGRAREADARADLYALGAILFEMLAGTAPHDATSLDALVAMKLTQPPRDLAALAPGTHPGVVALVHRCLALRPEDRPASAVEVQEELARLAQVTSAPVSQPPVSQPPVSQPPAAPGPSPAPTASPRWFMPVLLAALLGTACFAGIATLGAGGTVWALFFAPERGAPEDVDPAPPALLAPTGADPVGANPMGANPLGANPLGANPLGANPLGASPGSDPLAPEPVGATPGQESGSPSVDVAGTPSGAAGAGLDGVSISVSKLGGGELDVERGIAEAARPALARCRGEADVVEQLQFLWMGPSLVTSDGTPPTPTRRCIELAILGARPAGASSGIVRFLVALDRRRE